MHSTRVVGYYLLSWRTPFSLDFGFISVGGCPDGLHVCGGGRCPLNPHRLLYSHLPSSANSVLIENILKV